MYHIYYETTFGGVTVYYIYVYNSVLLKFLKRLVWLVTRPLDLGFALEEIRAFLSLPNADKKEHCSKANA
ncbi:hypothetical protein AQUCO_01400902v1 [Aquilegia coerulea]|uniref:Uncharacterized protein n=1 Tax=Aquilegia coerulea TaxID=218851 RepID=A0A2G5DYQ1_AQUCA|nr:hypothetical protein AQUCO_01400902v1 [Aquilegia coerulea]